LVAKVTFKIVTLF